MYINNYVCYSPGCYVAIKNGWRERVRENLPR